MTIREVYDLILKEGLYDFKATDPIHVVRNQILRHCSDKHFASASATKYFGLTDGNKYYPLSTPIHQNPDTVEIAQGHKLGNTIDQLTNELHPLQIEGNRKTELIREAISPKNTIISVVKKVLQDYGKAMTVRQIYDAIEREKLYAFRATEPMHVVRSQIRRHCVGLDFPSASSIKHFEMQGKNKYYFLQEPLMQPLALGQIGTNAYVEESSESLNSAESLSRPTTNRDQIFISYSHKDMRWLQRLQIHLKPLEKRGIITRWDDTQIKPGAKWRDEIKLATDRARIAILLISADFLASDFIIENELPPLLQAAAREGAMILPIIISPCRFEKIESLGQFQAINSPSKPLSALDRTKREIIFVKVVDAVEAALYTL